MTLHVTVMTQRPGLALSVLVGVYSAAKMASAALVETSAGKDAIAEGLLDLLKPAIQQLDLHVHSVR